MGDDGQWFLGPAEKSMGPKIKRPEWTHEFASRFGEIEQLELALTNERLDECKQGRHLMYSWASGYYTDEGTIGAPFRYACIIRGQVWGRNHPVEDLWMRCPAMDHLVRKDCSTDPNLIQSQIVSNVPAVDLTAEYLEEALERFKADVQKHSPGKKVQLGQQWSKVPPFEVFPEGIDPFTFKQRVATELETHEKLIAEYDGVGTKSLPLPDEHYEIPQTIKEWTHQTHKGFDRIYSFSTDQQRLYFKTYNAVMEEADASDDFTARVTRAHEAGLMAVDPEIEQGVVPDDWEAYYPGGTAADVIAQIALETIQENPLSPCCNAPTFIDGSRRICNRCRLSKPL